MDGNRRPLGGYMPLEAAMVFPAVFALIIMLLYATFFLYDKCRMTQDLYTAAYRQSIARSANAGGPKIDTSGYFMLLSCEAGVSGGSGVRASADGNRGRRNRRRQRRLGDQSDHGSAKDRSAAVISKVQADSGDRAAGVFRGRGRRRVNRGIF